MWCVLGLAVRVLVLITLHNQAYIRDHLTYTYWSRLAVEGGVLQVYSGPAVPDYRIYAGHNAHAKQMLAFRAAPRGDVPHVITVQAPDGQMLPLVIPAGRGDYDYAVYRPPPFSYPPLSAYLFWVLGYTHRAIDATQEIDTRLAHVIFAAPSIICDLLVAIVIAVALRDLRGAVAAEWGLCVVLFCPALIWDSSVWLQSDALPLVCIASTLLLLARDRLLLASAVCGIGLTLKPEVAWTVPLVAYAALERRSFRAVVLSGLAGIAPVLLISLPFLLSTGLLWFKIAYLDNASLYPRLTLSAYNPWWIVAGIRAVLVTEPTIQIPSHLGPAPLMSTLFDDRVPWMLGITPRAVGFMALAIALTILAMVWRRYTRRPPANVFVLAYLVYLAAFLFPTEVHERYILYTLPLATVAATQLRTMRLGLWALQCVAFVNLTGYVFFVFPFRATEISAIHWGMVGMLMMVVVATLLLFLAPQLEMWRVSGAPSIAAARSCWRKESGTCG